jgi:hypothetical protein
VAAAVPGGRHLAQAGDAEDQSQLRSPGADQSAGTIAANIIQVQTYIPYIASFETTRESSAKLNVLNRRLDTLGTRFPQLHSTMT